jgi:hypothetical protein
MDTIVSQSSQGDCSAIKKPNKKAKAKANKKNRQTHGLCIVYAKYDVSIDAIRANSYNESDKIIYDFMNVNSDKNHTKMGHGIIQNINDRYYVTTCNHIMTKYAKYYGYCLDILGNSVRFTMGMPKRLMELDLVVLEVTSTHNPPLSHIDLTKEVNPVYPLTKSNHIITIERECKGNDNILFKTEHINADVTMRVGILMYDTIRDIPLVHIPIKNMGRVTTVAKANNINISKVFKKIDVDKKVHADRDRASDLVSEITSGLSGSVIRSDEQNIGMIMIYADSYAGEILLYALPIQIIRDVTLNICNGTLKELQGLQVDTITLKELQTLHQDAKVLSKELQDLCTSTAAKHMIDKTNGLIVEKESSKYDNKTKGFCFHVADIIVGIDGLELNEYNMIWSNILGMHVPINTYVMLNNIKDPSYQFTVSIIKNTEDHAQTLYTLSCATYNSMYTTRVIDTGFIWNDLLFLEMSETIKTYYEQMGVVLDISLTNNSDYSTDGAKKVLLFNYTNKRSNKITTVNNNFPNMPIKQKNKKGVHYFYVVVAMGQNDIKSLDDLISQINTIDITQKSVTFQIVNPCETHEKYIEHVISLK